MLLCKLFYFEDGSLMLEIKFTAASVPHFVTNGRGEKGGNKQENIGRGLGHWIMLLEGIP